MISLPQCREHLMNVVIPREDHTIKVGELHLYSCGLGGGGGGGGAALH